VVAVVDGIEIKGRNWSRRLTAFLHRGRFPRTLPPAEKARGYRMILEEMIKELVEKRAAEMKVTDEEVTGRSRNSRKPRLEADVKKQIG
jgi:hypothetical protein